MKRGGQYDSPLFLYPKFIIIDYIFGSAYFINNCNLLGCLNRLSSYIIVQLNKYNYLNTYNLNCNLK